MSSLSSSRWWGRRDDDKDDFVTTWSKFLQNFADFCKKFCRFSRNNTKFCENLRKFAKIWTKICFTSWLLSRCHHHCRHVVLITVTTTIDDFMTTITMTTWSKFFAKFRRFWQKFLQIFAKYYKNLRKILRKYAKIYENLRKFTKFLRKFTKFCENLQKNLLHIIVVVTLSCIIVVPLHLRRIVVDDDNNDDFLTTILRWRREANFCKISQNLAKFFTDFREILQKFAKICFTLLSSCCHIASLSSDRCHVVVADFWQ